MKSLNYLISVSFTIVSYKCRIVLYIYGRILLGTTITIRCIACDEASLFVKIAGLAILMQSYFFVIRMIKILKTRMVEYSNRKKLGVKLRWFDPLTPKEMSTLGINDKKKVGEKIP
jgi:hypothetical protein